jgi:hypothetical protein
LTKVNPNSLNPKFHHDHQYIVHLQRKYQQISHQNFYLLIDHHTPQKLEKSLEALKALRVLAQHYPVNQMDRNNDNHRKVLIQNYRGTKSTSDLLRSNLLMKAQKIKLNKKISSITIINEGKQVSVDNVASDLQVSSLNELLGYIVHQKKDGKLSSLAKGLGFQLLSEDIDISSANTQQQLHSEVQSNRISAETSQEDHTA